jgi:hypothetical protein
MYTVDGSGKYGTNLQVHHRCDTITSCKNERIRSLWRYFGQTVDYSMCRPSFCPLTYGPDRQVAPSSLNQPDHYKETVSSKLQALGQKINKQQKRGRDNLHQTEKINSKQFINIA